MSHSKRLFAQQLRQLRHVGSPRATRRIDNILRFVFLVMAVTRAIGTFGVKVGGVVPPPKLRQQLSSPEQLLCLGLRLVSAILAK
jgi:hypothetical protein